MIKIGSIVKANNEYGIINNKKNGVYNIIIHKCIDVNYNKQNLSKTYSEINKRFLVDKVNEIDFDVLKPSKTNGIYNILLADGRVFNVTEKGYKFLGYRASLKDLGERRKTNLIKYEIKVQMCYMLNNNVF